MHYYYMCGNEKIRVFVWNDDFHTEVTVEDSTTRKCYERTIRTDDAGKKFFTWNKNKVFLDNWIKSSMKELVEKLQKKERIFGDDLTRAILSDGVENVKFEVPMPTRSCWCFVDPTKRVNTICRIDESRYNREVKNNYKIVLVPVEENNEVASYEDYYTTDLASLIENGYIKIITD